MTKRNSQILLFFVVVASVYLAACERVKDPCLLPRVAPLGIGTYKAIETDTGIAIKDSVLPSPIMAALDSPAAFVYIPEQATSKFRLSLSPLTDSTKYFILPDTLNTTASGFDTMTVYYVRKLHFLSTACGYTHFFSIYDVKTTNHVIDSVKLVQTEVTTAADVEHVKIYY